MVTACGSDVDNTESETNSNVDETIPSITPTPTPTSKPNSKQSKKDFEKYLNSGNKRFKQKDYRGAIADYTKAIKTDRNNATAYYNRAGARMELKDYKGAIADYTKAIEINPKYAEAYYNRGLARKLDGDKQGAIKDFSEYDKRIICPIGDPRCHEEQPTESSIRKVCKDNSIKCYEKPIRFPQRKTTRINKPKTNPNSKPKQRLGE